MSYITEDVGYWYWYDEQMGQHKEETQAPSQGAITHWDFVEIMKRIDGIEKKSFELYKKKGVRYNKFEDESVNSVNP